MGFFPVGQCWGRWFSERQPAAFPVGLRIYPYKVVSQHELVGQFRSADGLALLGGREAGASDREYLRLIRFKYYNTNTA
jgi:hypothetical protein